MVSLTIQQRDLLREILTADQSVVVADLARQMNLSPRQVSYRLKSVRAWLAQHDVVLKTTPGVGIEVACSSNQRHTLLNELGLQTDFQLTLTSDQRRQLFALSLLTALEPLTLYGLQHITDVSRMTILKDLDSLEGWVQRFGLALVRRPNYGIWLDGPELARRQALVALLWGDSSLGEPLTRLTYDKGLVFSLSNDAGQLSIVQQTQHLLSHWNIHATLEGVAYAETQLGGRFTDDAVLHLALVFATQAQRVRTGEVVSCDSETVAWLQKQKVWPVSETILHNLLSEKLPTKPNCEIAANAMHLLAGTRSHVWPGALDVEPELSRLVVVLMEEVAQAFATPGLCHDEALRDGLVAHIIPAYMRQRFKLWAPPSWSDGALSRQYKHEYNIACELATVVAEQTGVNLPEGEIDTLTLLLRAAFIRERPNHPKRAFIICPSGMATAQLLVARLKTRFPSLEILGVLSLRELTPERVGAAQLLITTVPLLQPPRPGLPVIQVHPLLLPEDIETITNWLT